jgi:hypothetical protein
LEVDVPSSNVWRQVDLLLDGRLREVLTELREAGTSTEQIARQLLTQHGAVVSTRTIANWCKQLRIIPTNRVPATPPTGTASPAGRAEGVNPPDTEEPHASGSPAGGEIEAVAS